MLAPQTFHPELDTLFDQAQIHGVSVDFDGRSFVLLSQKDFDTVLAGSSTTAEMIKHVPVPRIDKPITYILTRDAFDDLVRLHEQLIDLIEETGPARGARSW